MNSINKFAIISAAVMLSAAAFAGCANSGTENISSEASAASNESDNQIIAQTAKYSNKTVDYSEESSVKISFDDTGAVIDGQGANYRDGTVTISAGGEYLISGKTENSRIIVDCGEENVKLILDNADISCDDNSALFISSAKNAYIILKDGTENSLSDGAEYSDDNNADGCIFSKADLIIGGSGTLNIVGNYKHGIVSKDDLAIIGGTLNVTAVSSGICGKDLVEIWDGVIAVKAGNDGIKSTNTEDADKGGIIIGGGSITVESEDNCISSAAGLEIIGGVFNLTANGGFENAESKVSEDDFRMGGGGFADGMGMRDKNDENKIIEGNAFDSKKEGFAKSEETDIDMTPPERMNESAEFSEHIAPPDEGFTRSEGRGDMLPPENSEEFNTAEEGNESEESESSAAKGLKADSDLNISGGELNIDSAGDSIHSNGNVTVSAGTLTLSSGSQGIHADSSFLITDGDISITESYEGIEAKTITVSGGNISVVSSDDGFNGTNGSGSDMFSVEDGVYIEINGGVTELNAGGDGIDSNGDFYLKGGEVYVSGSANGGDGAIDCTGTAEVSGGTIIACGASGMAEGFDNSSLQYSVFYNLESIVSEGDELVISDSDGKTILSYTLPKSWQNIVFSSPELEEGETYTITAGEQSEAVTIDSTVTSNTSENGFGGKIRR